MKRTVLQYKGGPCRR